MPKRENARGWTHDVLVIGAGAAGLTAAGGCGRLGLRTALIERARMGGECLNTGCVPSKALLAAARRAHAMRGDALGIAGHEPGIDFAAVRAHVQGAIAAIAPHDARERFEAWGVEVIAGDARFTGARTVDVNGRVLCAPRIVLACGSDPLVPAIPGLAEVPHLTNETVFGLAALPRHLLVLGGGSVGVELAQAFRRLGAAVSLVDSGALLAAADPDAVALLRASLRAEGVVVHEHTVVTRVGAVPDGVRAERSNGLPIDASHVLVAAGRRARTGGLGLERAGVAVGPDGIVVDARRRTTNRAVFAIGDCRAGPRLTHAAGYEGAQVVAAIGFGLPSPVDYGALPKVTYTDPEVAQLGLTAAEARQRHSRVTVWEEPFADNDRAVTEGRTEGFVRCVRAGRRLLGVTIVGDGAGDLLLPWSQVMAGRASLWALSGATVPYPTRSEASKAAAFAPFAPRVFGPAARRWARALAALRARVSAPGQRGGGALSVLARRRAARMIPGQP